MEEEEIKKIFEDSMDSPSYEFSTKTMRKIEALEASKERLSIKGNSSIIAYLIPMFFLVLLISSFFLSEPQYISFDLTFSFPDIKSVWMNFNIHFSLLIASIAITTGFWSWIWWEKHSIKTSKF